MFNRKHTIDSIKKIYIFKSKSPLGLYDINNILITKPFNLVELAIFIKINKSLISRYIKTGKLLLNKYYLRKLKIK
jgi:hypothetical protein